MYLFVAVSHRLNCSEKQTAFGNILSVMFENLLSSDLISFAILSNSANESLFQNQQSINKDFVIFGFGAVNLTNRTKPIIIKLNYIFLQYATLESSSHFLPV